MAKKALLTVTAEYAHVVPSQSRLLLLFAEKNEATKYKSYQAQAPIPNFQTQTFTYLATHAP